MGRACQPLLAEYVAAFPCVAIIGPRQCGKATLAGSLPADWRRFDLERASDRDLVARDPDLFFRLNPRQVVIDEPQLLPDLFAALRVAIDADRSSAGAEIDLVLEGDVGLVPIEIKYTHTLNRRRLAALREFVAERKCRYCLVITNDSEPRLLDEAIVAIPFSHL
jgi:predicted AAA+ superfamily ATPase